MNDYIAFHLTRLEPIELTDGPAPFDESDEAYVRVGVHIVRNNSAIRSFVHRKPGSTDDQGTESDGSFHWSVSEGDSVPQNRDGLICFLLDEPLAPGDSMGVTALFMEQDGGPRVPPDLDEKILQVTALAASMVPAPAVPVVGGIGAALAGLASLLEGLENTDDVLGSVAFSISRRLDGTYTPIPFTVGPETSGGHQEGLPDGPSNLEQWLFSLRGDGSNYSVAIRVRAHD